MSDRHFAAWEKWQHKLLPLSRVSRDPPKWVLPGFLPPGMTLLAGEAKTLKSTLVLAMGAALADSHPVPGYTYAKKAVVARERRTVVYIGYEQSAGRLRVAYERRILKRELKPKETSFVCVKSPAKWQVDEPMEGCDPVRLLRELKPILLVLDPLILAHSQDENDPRMIRPFVPLRDAALELEVSVLLVHHMNKGGEEGGRGASTRASFNRVRGTSALWGMMDAGHLVSKSPSGGLYYTSEFKDFPARQWTWRKP